MSKELLDSSAEQLANRLLVLDVVLGVIAALGVYIAFLQYTGEFRHAPNQLESEKIIDTDASPIILPESSYIVVPPVEIKK